jgi:hypothetical protein
MASHSFWDMSPCIDDTEKLLYMALYFSRSIHLTKREHVVNYLFSQSYNFTKIDSTIPSIVICFCWVLLDRVIVLASKFSPKISKYKLYYAGNEILLIEQLDLMENFHGGTS